MASLLLAATVVLGVSGPAPDAIEILREKMLRQADPPTLEERRKILKWVTGPEPVDPGGDLIEYLKQLRHLQDWPTIRKEITGTCISACTVFLAAPNLCVAPQAVFWFHAPHRLETLEIQPAMRGVMLNTYPKPVRHWVEVTGALDSIAFRHKLTGAELIAMGFARCPEADPPSAPPAPPRPASARGSRR